MPAYTHQLKDARESDIKKVAGVCKDGDEFRDYVNEATRRLIKRGSWFDTEQVVRFCYTGCDIVFPRWVGTVMGVKLCAQGNVPIHNNWWSIVGPRRDYSGGLAASWFAGLRDNGTVPIYSQVSGTTGKQIAYHVTNPRDVGKTVTIFGLQYGGQPLAEQRDGVWCEGIQITAIQAGGAVLPAMTETLVTKITSVVRDATVGVSYLYEYGPDADGINALRDLAMYQPTETNPRYRRMTLSGILSEPFRTNDNGQRIRTLEAICKLEFIPAVSDDDFLLLDDWDALKLAVQAIRLEESGDSQAAELKWASAIREMNYTERSKTPGNQISVRVNVLGSNRTLSNPI